MSLPLIFAKRFAALCGKTANIWENRTIKNKSLSLLHKKRLCSLCKQAKLIVFEFFRLTNSPCSITIIMTIKGHKGVLSPKCTFNVSLFLLQPIETAVKNQSAKQIGGNTGGAIRKTRNTVPINGRLVFGANKERMDVRQRLSFHSLKASSDVKIEARNRPNTYGGVSLEKN